MKHQMSLSEGLNELLFTKPRYKHYTLKFLKLWRSYDVTELSCAMIMYSEQAMEIVYRLPDKMKKQWIEGNHGSVVFDK